jgi:hypothetical protein
VCLPILERAQPTRVIDVSVRRDCEERLRRLLAKPGDHGCDRSDAVPGIDQEIAVTARNHKGVRPKQRVNVGLDDPDDSIVDAFGLEPDLAERQTHPQLPPCRLPLAYGSIIGGSIP